MDQWEPSQSAFPGSDQLRAISFGTKLYRMLGLDRLSRTIDGFEFVSASHSELPQYHQSLFEDHELEGTFDLGLHQRYSDPTSSHSRNSFLETEMGMKAPKATKTGTTIVGILYAVL